MDEPNLGSVSPKNHHLLSWVKEVSALTQPEKIFWVDGSEAEKSFLLKDAVNQGVLIALNQEKLPGCYYHRSNPNDVARVEQCTYICTPAKDQAGPTNHWAAPREMHERLRGMLQGAMKGRTMYVVPYLMGPPGSPLTKVGVEITDSLYVVLNMRIMSRMGQIALDQLGPSDDFNRGIHSLLDCHPDRRIIAHFPQENAIISVGSGYGGNVLLGKKCLALRIGSYLGREQGWMAEHMLDEARIRRQTLRHQPRSRILWGCPRHELSVEPQRHGDDRSGHDLYECRPHPRWRGLVGGNGRTSPRRNDRLAGATLDAGVRRKGRPPELPVYLADAK